MFILHLIRISDPLFHSIDIFQTMRLIILTIFLVSLIAFGFTKSNLTINDQVKDYNVYLGTLLKKEGMPDIHIPMDSIRFNLEKLQEEIQTKRSQIDLFKLYSSTTAMIQCGHTQVQPSNNVLKEWVGKKNSLPVDYILVGKKLFTQKNQSEDKKVINNGKTLLQQKRTIPPNCEIISIDSIKVEEMMQTIANYVSSDEDGMDFRYYQVSQLFEFFRYIAYPRQQDSTQVVYVSRKDTVKTYLYNGYPPLKSINKRLKDFETNVNKGYNDFGKFSIQKGKYGYFKFVSFSKSKGLKYEEFLKKSFETLQKKKIKYLMVDLRGNTGGQIQYSLMRYFVGADIKLGKYDVLKPKKIFENLHIKKRNKFYFSHRLLTFVYKHKKKKHPEFDGTIHTAKVDEKLIYKGKIIVITDEATFSAGSVLACHLKTLCKAKIVGHTAGGSFYKGNAGTLMVVLPKSKFTFVVNPNTFWTHLADNPDSQSIKIPDHMIDPIYPGMKKKDDWYLNKVTKFFK